MTRRDLIKLLSILGVSSMLPFGHSAFAAAQPTLSIPPLLRPDANGRIRLKIQQGQSQWGHHPTTTWGYNGPLLGPALSLQRGQKVQMEVENALNENTVVHWHGLKIPGIVDGGPQSSVAPGGIWKPELVIDQPAATCWLHPHPHARTGRQVAMGLAGLILISDAKSQRLPLPKNWGVDDIPVILQDKRLNAAGQIDYTMDDISAAVGWFGDLMLTNGSPYPQHAAPRGWLRLRLLNGSNARSMRLAASDGRPLYVIASDGGFLTEPVKLAELPILMGERFEVLVDLRDGKAFDLVTLPVKQMGMTLPPFDRPLPVLRIQPTESKGHTVLPDQLAVLPPLPRLEALPVRTLKLSMNPILDQRGMEQLMQRYGHAAMAGMSMDMHGGATAASDPHAGHGSMDMPASGQGMDHNMAQGMGQGMNHGMAHSMGQGQNAGIGHDMPNMPNQGMNHGATSMDAPQQAPGQFDLWRSNYINGQAFMMDKPMFDVKKGQYERWIISGVGDMMLHPFHIHGTQFRILSEDGAPPQKHRSGFKDIVRVEGKVSEVLVRFDHPAPKEHAYMAHCHLLEHEDTGMMLAFTVSG